MRDEKLSQQMQESAMGFGTESGAAGHSAARVRVSTASNDLTSEDDLQSSARGGRNRFLGNLSLHLDKLRRIADTQRPGMQTPHQRQFDDAVRQLAETHATLLERGFLTPRETAPAEQLANDRNGRRQY